MCFHTTIQLWNHKLITFLAISISVGVGDFLCRVERPSILGRVERPSILGRVERPSILGRVERPSILGILNNHREETRLDVGRFTVVISVHAKCFEDLFIASRPTLPITRRVWEIL